MIMQSIVRRPSLSDRATFERLYSSVIAGEFDGQ